MIDIQIGIRFRQWIESTGKSQKEIAVLLDTSPVVISNLVSGKRRIGPDIKRRLEESGADVDWILTGRQKDVSELEKGRVLAKYFIPKQYGVNKVVAESQTTDEGYNVTVYEVLEQKSVMALAAEPKVEYEDEVVPEPQVKVERIRTPIKTVAATPIYVKGQNKK